MGHNKLWLLGVPFYLIGYMVGLIIMLIHSIWPIGLLRRWNFLVDSMQSTMQFAQLQMVCGFIQSVAAYALYCNGFSTLCWWVLLGPSVVYCAIHILFKVFFGLANALLG